MIKRCTARIRDFDEGDGVPYVVKGYWTEDTEFEVIHLDERGDEFNLCLYSSASGFIWALSIDFDFDREELGSQPCAEPVTLPCAGPVPLIRNWLSGTFKWLPKLNAYLNSCVDLPDPISREQSVNNEAVAGPLNKESAQDGKTPEERTSSSHLN